jgi:trehalose-phosphatase
MRTAAQRIPSEPIEAVVLDLDGVVIQTAMLHARAWKTMLDTFLKGYQNGPAAPPLDIRREYPRYLDGKPCLEGIRRFLASRNVSLPEGSCRDAPGTETLHGLSNLKNRLFLRLAEEEGVDVYADTVSRLKKWRAEGKKIAGVTFGKNGAVLLRRAGIEHLFDALVDGTTLVRRGLGEELTADLYLQAATALGVAPCRALVIENATPEVQAGSRSRFGLAVGVARHAQAGEMVTYGGDETVKSLAELEIPHSLADTSATVSAPELPSALEKLKAMGSEPLGQHLAFFLSYDGPLAPLVSRAEEAQMPDIIRELVKQLASVCTVVIVSGRDRADLAARVGLPELIYAGSYGLDISGPDGLALEHPEADCYLPDLRNAGNALHYLLEDVDGVQIEPKKYALAVHYRNVPEDKVAYVKDVAHGVGCAYHRLRITEGNQVLQLRPALDWHQGRAAIWIMEALRMDPARTVPIYLGGDPTDEEAFRTLRDTGVGIRVGGQGEPTQAVYRLEDIEQVEQLLLIAVQFLKK